MIEKLKRLLIWAHLRKDRNMAIKISCALQNEINKKLKAKETLK